MGFTMVYEYNIPWNNVLKLSQPSQITYNYSYGNWGNLQTNTTVKNKVCIATDTFLQDSYYTKNDRNQHNAGWKVDNMKYYKIKKDCIL